MLAHIATISPNTYFKSPIYIWYLAIPCIWRYDAFKESMSQRVSDSGVPSMGMSGIFPSCAFYNFNSLLQFPLRLNIAPLAIPGNSTLHASGLETCRT